jgi:phospholipase/carboxylesterase
MTDLIFQQGDAAPKRLIIMLHGVGSSANDLAPLGQAISASLSDARVLIPDGFDPFDQGGAGRQWFSVRGVTPANRTQRVDEALPRLLDWIEQERLDAGVAPEAVGLFGFSQGAILALAAAARGAHLGAVVAAAGRLVDPVRPASAKSPRMLLLHGTSDAVIPIHEGADAARRLVDAGYAVRFEQQDGQGHGVSAPQIAAAARWFAG